MPFYFQGPNLFFLASGLEDSQGVKLVLSGPDNESCVSHSQAGIWVMRG